MRNHLPRRDSTRALAWTAAPFVLIIAILVAAIVFAPGDQARFSAALTLAFICGFFVATLLSVGFTLGHMAWSRARMDALIERFSDDRPGSSH
jgi:Na+/proline symporter